MDKALFSERVQVERKVFTFELSENVRGRFLRITEDVRGRKDAVIIPATGLDEVRKLMNRVVQANRDAGEPPVDSSLADGVGT